MAQSNCHLVKRCWPNVFLLPLRLERCEMLLQATNVRNTKICVNTCMHAYIYICVCACVYLYIICVYLFIYSFIYLFIYSFIFYRMCACVCVFLRYSIFIYNRICTMLCMHECSICSKVANNDATRLGAIPFLILQQVAQPFSPLHTLPVSLQ